MSASKPAASKLRITNTTTNRLTFEDRDEKGTLRGYLKVGSTLDDALVQAGRKALGSSQVFDAEAAGRLQENSPIFRSMVEKGQIRVAAA